MCVFVCVSFSHLSVKLSIDHYLGLSSIHTNGLHYLLINTDGWRWAIWQFIIRAWRGWGRVEVGHSCRSCTCSDTAQNEKGQVCFPCLPICQRVCMCVLSEGCRARDGLRIRYLRSHYTVSVNMLKKMCCWELWMSTVLLKLYWTAAPGKQDTHIHSVCCFTVERQSMLTGLTSSEEDYGQMFKGKLWHFSTWVLLTYIL